MTQNALFINYEYCSGCHSCEFACRNEKELPLEDFGIKVLEDRPVKYKTSGKWHWDYMAYPTELCDMCKNRVQQGMMPACVQVCQAKCLHYGTIEECSRMLAEKGNKAAIFIP